MNREKQIEKTSDAEWADKNQGNYIGFDPE